MKQSLFSIFLFLCLAHPALADVTRVEATIDKNPVMVDEAIQLTVTAQGDPAREAFDSSPLLKDFVVGRTSVSTQTRIINFDKEETVTWTTTLFPRGEGNFTIPALTVEGKQTKPLTVNVIPVQAGQDEPARDYYLTTDVDTSEVYLHQQLLYTVKLYLASNIERGSLQAPELKDAQIQQLGDDKQYSDIVNGKRYQVIERTFAIVPQSSGEFTIKGPVFAGEVLAQDPNTRFGFFNRTKQINRLGPDITIHVKPVPADIDYHWLPSEYVSLNEEWPQQSSFTVGEPVTRTITLTAMGVVEEQLPELPQMYPPGFKLYPDQASTATVNKNNTLIAQRVETLAMIPTQAGDFILPEVTVPWFNVLTGKTETARLPAKKITVAPASATATPVQSAPLTQAQSDNTALPAPAAQPDIPQGAQGTVPQSAPAESNDTLLWIVSALWIVTLAGWIITVIYFRRRPVMQGEKPSDGRGSAGNDEKQAFNSLQKVMQTGAPGEVQKALRQWALLAGKQHSPAVPADIYLRKSGLQPQIDAMLSSQYSDKPQQWDRKALLQSIQAIRQQNTKQSNSALPPLYPEGQSS